MKIKVASPESVSIHLNVFLISEGLRYLGKQTKLTEVIPLVK